MDKHKDKKLVSKEYETGHSYFIQSNEPINSIILDEDTAKNVTNVGENVGEEDGSETGNGLEG
jgi:hypothetical protein